MSKKITDNIVDLDLSVTKKKKFRFDKDNDRIVEINVSDMNMLARLTEAYTKLDELGKEASNVTNIDNDGNDMELSDMKIVSERLLTIDKKMRELIDYIFDAEVSCKAAPEGSMYDPFNGQFRYEWILQLLIAQYENNMDSEFEKIRNQLDKHVKKYQKG